MSGKLSELVKGHSGEFRCRGISDETRSKVVPFRHLAIAPRLTEALPKLPELSAFYEEFGSLVLYYEPESEECAFYIAPPDHWKELECRFRMWLEGMTDEEMAGSVPPWVNDCLVVGSLPGTGNYLLIPSAGEDRGKVFEFEHDGFEFIELADSLPSFIRRCLEPTPTDLVAMASHLRFGSAEENEQWWIVEMRDNYGRVVRTEA